MQFVSCVSGNEREKDICIRPGIVAVGGMNFTTLQGLSGADLANVPAALAEHIELL